MLPIPSPVTKRPARAGVVPPESQNSGKPTRATHRVAAKSVVEGTARASRLPRRRPASMATKKRVRTAAAPGRVKPALSSRKSAPQYPTHHSEATPKETRAQNAQYRGGNVRDPGRASPSPGRAPRSGRARDLEKERTAKRMSAAT